jgi:hypothetical protein
MTDHSVFPPIEGLLNLACRNGVDIRPTLLRVLTDLYTQTRSHSPSEEAQYVELALRLIDSVDAATLNAVATRLAAYSRAPSAIVARLHERGGSFSAPQEPTPARPPENDLGNSFFAADSYERQLILTNLEAATPPASTHNIAAAVETCSRLEAAVLDHNVAEFIRLLESSLMLPHATAEKIANDASGEAIIVATKALGMPNAKLQRILLLINPAIGHSVERVYELAALYDEINAHTAEAMVQIWRGVTAKRRDTHQTMLYDDEGRSARVAATPMRYQAPRRSEPLATRFRNSGR